MSIDRADVVICGAGIAGIATAHALATQYGVRNVVLVDERAPLTLTSDKSTEAYRNWWPGPDDAMVRLMNRSIDLLEQWSDDSGDRFLMNRRGYLYATADASKIPAWRAQAALAESQGAGGVREIASVHDLADYRPSTHTGYRDHPDGADFFVDRDAIARAFPFLSTDIAAVLHARRCGWVSAQQLGMWLFDEARAAGVRFISGRVTAVETHAGAVSGVSVAPANAATVHIHTPVFVNCAGPFAQQVGRLLGIELPLFSEMHLKIAFEDTLGAVDRNTGLVILDDEQQLSWTDDERADLAADPATEWLTRPMPAGIHLRPEGYRNSKTVLMLWDYHSTHRYSEPVFPLDDDPVYAEVVMRGMVQLVPALAPYVERLPHTFLDGGYYTKTIENRPLIGPLPLHGAYVNAAFSGYGVMAAPAAGELLAAQITGSTQPAHAAAFLPDRYESAAYQERLRSWGGTGQL